MNSIGEFGEVVLLVTLLCLLLALAMSRIETDGSFLVKVFFFGLLVRIVLGTMIHGFQLEEFFGGDALTYDFYGQVQLSAWNGDGYSQALLGYYSGGLGQFTGMGMVYLVGTVYYLFGRNILTIQYLEAIMGAATGPIFYLCAQQLLGNRRVSRVVAILVGFFPSLVLWSSQALKDGVIVFLLALSMLATLKLQRQLSLKYLALIILCPAAIITLRFYVFYMLVLAIVGSFLMRLTRSSRQLVSSFALILVVGFGLSFVGLSSFGMDKLEKYADLHEVQRSRADLAKRAESSFSKDADVSTTSGAIRQIPEGLIFLLFAPFPWNFSSLRQAITLPEMIVWWGSFPMLGLGLWFAIRYRLRDFLPILIFTTLLTLVYSVVQGNVGTAYRQRSQLLIFYFVFVAIGFVLLKERAETRKRVAAEQEALSFGGTMLGPFAPESS